MQLNNELSHAKFREIVKSQTLALRTFCQRWKKELQNPELPEDVVGEINVANGQSELLIQERFSQFANLIDDSEFKRSEKEITLGDLQGFWDIIYFQVENIKKNFDKLDKLKRNDWKLPSVESSQNLQASKAKPLTLHNKPAIRSKPGGVSRSNIRDHILAQRKKLKQEKNEKENAPLNSTKTSPDVSSSSGAATETKKFEAGFFEIHTPVQGSRSSHRKRFRQNLEASPGSSPKVLASSALKKRIQQTPVLHKDYSPCMRITRSMKKRMQHICESTP